MYSIVYGYITSVIQSFKSFNFLHYMPTLQFDFSF